MISQKLILALRGGGLKTFANTSSLTLIEENDLGEGGNGGAVAIILGFVVMAMSSTEPNAFHWMLIVLRVKGRKVGIGRKQWCSETV